MKKLLFLITACVAVAALAIAHGHEEFQKAMKEISSGFSGLRKAVDAKQGPEAAAAAEKLVPLMKQVQEHFEEHKMQDGISWAKTAQDAAGQLAAAANSGDWEKAANEVKTLGATCQTCHTAHRVKSPDGTYTMK